MKKILYILPILVLILMIIVMNIGQKGYIKLNNRVKYKVIEIKKADPKNDGNVHIKLYIGNKEIRTYNVNYSYGKDIYKIDIYEKDNYFIVKLEGNKNYLSFFNLNGMHIDTVLYDEVDTSNDRYKALENGSVVTYKYYIDDNILFKEIDDISYINNE